MFGCQSSEIFRKRPEFSNSRNFCKKVRKKVWKSLDINRNCTSILEILKKLRKVWVFESKILEKVRKNFGKSSGKVRKQGFPNVWKQGFPNVQKFWKFQKLFYSKISENDVKLELWKSRKTRSNSKTDSKVWLKFWNAGPYYLFRFKSNYLCIGLSPDLNRLTQI